MFLSFITSKLGLSLIAVALVVAVIGVHLAGDAHVKHELLSERKATAAVQADLTVCHSNGQALEASLAAQNSAVTALKAESDARVAASVKAVSGARAVAESYRQNAASILKARPGVDRCASADALIAEAVK